MKLIPILLLAFVPTLGVACSSEAPAKVQPRLTAIVIIPTPTPGFPSTSASALTAPPTDLNNINSESHRYGTGADPNIVTLGPKIGYPSWSPYAGKTSINFVASHAAPILAPINMMLVGFTNRSAKYRTREGVRQSPYNDLELCFRSIDSDWPEMVTCAYHLMTSPLLTAHDINPGCIEDDEWGTSGSRQTEGWIFYETNDAFSSATAKSSECGGLLGKTVARGDVIGYSGSVGTHPQSPFRFKVPDASKNPLVEQGDKHLHWVQPSSFFFWKCYGPGVRFPPGVLAYPFECGGYKLPSPQSDSSFKYSQ